MRVITKVANNLIMLQLFILILFGIAVDSAYAENTAANVTKPNQEFQQLLKHWLPGKIKSSQWQDISPYQAALKAIENNLSLQQVRVDAEIKHAAIAEARAIFDPQFSVALGYSKTQRNDRVSSLDRYKKETITIEEGQPLPLMDSEGNPVLCEQTAGCLQADGSLIDFGDRIPLEGGNILCTERLADENGLCHMSAIPDNDFTKYVMLDSHRDAGFYPSDPIKASESFLTGNAVNNVLDISVQQKLPWGGSLNLLFSVNKKEAYWINNNNEFSDLRDIYHNNQSLATFGNYHRPWASSITLSASLPLPKTKDFGSNNQFDTTIKQAVLQDHQSQSEVKRIINQTLLSVAQTYWELVSAKHELLLLMENLSQLKNLNDNTSRMYEQRMLTRYDKEQVEAEFKQVKLQVHQTFKNFLSVAYQLRQLMGDRGALALPIDYNYENQAAIIDDYSQLLQMANDYNPDIEVQQYNIDMAELSLKFSQNQARPDIDFNVAIKASQNNSPFGYESFSDSVSNIRSPDTILQQYQLNYNYPILNRAVKANVKQAASALRTQELTMQQQRTTVAYAIENALITLQSSRLSTNIAQRQRDLAKKTLEKAIKQQEIREVTEYEIVDKNQVLLDAERQLISAQKRFKQAEASLLSGLGILPAHYVEHTLNSSFDAYRINYLKAYRQLYYFVEAEEL